MWGNAIFKPGIGSMCQARTCKKARYRGDSIDYWINNSYFCEEHAKNACTGSSSKRLWAENRHTLVPKDCTS